MIGSGGTKLQSTSSCIGYITYYQPTMWNPYKQDHCDRETCKA